MSGARQQCFRCHGYGHFAGQCPTRGLSSLLMEEEVPQEGQIEVYETSQDWEEEYENQYAEMDPSIGVIRCTLTQVNKDDWRRTTIFHTFIKIGNHVRKVILDNGSCVNAVSPDTVNLLGLHITPHPNSYRVSWIDATSVPVSTRCLVPITFALYHDQVWCDIIPMELGSILLGRPWLYDVNATIQGRTNICLFEHNGKKIQLNPSPPRVHLKKNIPIPQEQPNNPPLKAEIVKSIHLINKREMEQELAQESHAYAVILTLGNSSQ